MNENIAKHFGGNVYQDRYSDLINRKVDDRTGDEIAMDIINRAGLKVKS